MNKTVLVIGIILLLIGASVVSSTGKIVKDYPFNNNFLGSVNNQKDPLSCDHLGYVFSSEQDCFLYEFILNDPSDLTCVCEVGSGGFMSGATWSIDYCIYCVEYATGILWRIDPDSCDMWEVGGGGQSLNCLEYDYVTDRMYGISSSDTAYEIDPETGKQTELFKLGYPGGYMVGISFDSEGVCYGWDLVMDTLWIIDFNTEEVTQVGPLGFNLNYAVPGDFCKEDDILYLVVDNSLYASGEYVGDFPGYVTVTELVIPYDCDFSPPNTIHSLDPSEPDGLNGWYVSDVNVTLNATDYISGVKEIKYKIGDGAIQTIDGDNGTFAITQEHDADDLRVVYWAIDRAGNQETPNFFYIDMDQTEPFTDLIYEVIGGNPWQGWDFLFMFTVIDEISGWNYTYYRIDGGEWILYTGGPFILSGDEFFIEYYSVDFAGNVGWGDANITDCTDVQSSDNMLLLRILERFPLLERLFYILLIR